MAGISQYPPASVIKSQQTGTILLVASGANDVAVVVTAVNSAYALIQRLGQTHDNSVAADDTRLYLTAGGATTDLHVVRNAVVSGDNITVGYQLLEFTY